MTDEPKRKKEKKFIKLPEYPGGKKALIQFISEHLQYPQDALDAGIEGIVAVRYEVNDSGSVVSTRIIKSLFPSCDEEAMRLVRLLQYGKVVNRGVRVKSKFKINIHFGLKKIPENTIQIAYTISASKKSPKQDIPKSTQNQSYSYSIQIPEE